MSKNWLSQVCLQVYAQFPEVDGVRPTQDEQSNGNYLLIFKGSVIAANGKRIQRTVRAVVNENGKIIKISTSR